MWWKSRGSGAETAMPLTFLVNQEWSLRRQDTRAAIWVSRNESGGSSSACGSGRDMTFLRSWAVKIWRAAVVDGASGKSYLYVPNESSVFESNSHVRENLRNKRSWRYPEQKQGSVQVRRPRANWEVREEASGSASACKTCMRD
jgi:hypothetical protein